MAVNYHNVICVHVRAGMQYAVYPMSAKKFTSLSNRLFIEDGRFLGYNAAMDE